MYTIFYKRFMDYYVIFEICLMASKSARMRGSGLLAAPGLDSALSTIS